MDTGDFDALFQRVSEGLVALATGWEWVCRHCGHVNRGTDSSLFCEACGTPR